MQPVLALAFLAALPSAPIQARASARPAAKSGCATAPTVFVGRVLGTTRRPVAGAVVVSSAGGSTVSAADGTFALAVDVPLAAECVEVSAAAEGERLAA